MCLLHDKFRPTHYSWFKDIIILRLSYCIFTVPYMHFVAVSMFSALEKPDSPPPPHHYKEAWLQVPNNSTCIHAFQRCIKFFAKQTSFPLLTLSADPVMTSVPSSDMSTAKMAALCPVSVVKRRQREMSHTLACRQIKCLACLNCTGG